MNKAFDKFTPRPAFDLIKVEDRKSSLITHALYNY